MPVGSAPSTLVEAGHERPGELAAQVGVGVEGVVAAVHARDQQLPDEPVGKAITDAVDLVGGGGAVAREAVVEEVAAREQLRAELVDAGLRTLQGADAGDAWPLPDGAT